MDTAVDFVVDTLAVVVVDTPLLADHHCNLFEMISKKYNIVKTGRCKYSLKCKYALLK